MTFDDLKEMEGQIITYYEVKGNSIKAKKGKIKKSGLYGGDAIELKLVDKLGRCQNYIYHVIYGYKITKSNVYDCGYVKLYLDREEAYKFVLNKLREERREIDKKMYMIQKELFGKKDEG